MLSAPVQRRQSTAHLDADRAREKNLGRSMCPAVPGIQATLSNGHCLGAEDEDAAATLPGKLALRAMETRAVPGEQPGAPGTPRRYRDMQCGVSSNRGQKAATGSRNAAYHGGRTTRLALGRAAAARCTTTAQLAPGPLPGRWQQRPCSAWQPACGAWIWNTLGCCAGAALALAFWVA